MLCAIIIANKEKVSVKKLGIHWCEKSIAIQLPILKSSEYYHYQPKTRKSIANSIAVQFVLRY